MQACGRLVARMGEQDVDRDIAAGIEIDGGDMALVMGDLDDPASTAGMLRRAESARISGAMS